jgi:hypothetical protein
MTDTNRGKQALSLTLTAIMVLSMVAIGISAFAGSAAALPGGGNSSIAANPAGHNVGSTTHTITLNVSEGDSLTSVSDFGQTSGDDITVEYDDSNDVVNPDDNALVDDEVSVIRDGSVQDTADSVTASELSTNDDGNLTIDVGSAGSKMDVDIQAGDKIRFAVDADHTTGSFLDGQGSSETINITAQSSEGDETGAEFTLTAGGDFERIDSTNTVQQTFDSFEQAVDSATSDDTVTVPSGEFTELFRQPVSVGTGSIQTASVSQKNVTISGQGADSSTVISGANGGELLDDSDAARDSLTVEQVTLDGNGVLNNAGDIVDLTGGTSSGTTVQDSDIVNASSNGFDTGQSEDLTVDTVTFDDSDPTSDYTAIDIGTAGSSGSDIGITQVTANNLSAGTGVNIGSSANADVTVSINNTDVELNGAGTGFSLQIDDTNGNNQRVIAENNTVDEVTSGKDGTGIDLKTGDNDANPDVTVNGSSTNINGTSTGLSINNVYRGNSLDVFNATFDNIGSEALQLTDTGGGSTTVNVEDITVQNSAGAKGINVNDDGVTLNLDTSFNSNTNSQINDVATGVDLQAVSTVNDISNTSFDNIGTTALDIGADGGSLTLEDITVNGQNSATAINDDTPNDLTVRESQLGSSGTAVGAGVDLADTSSRTVTVTDTDFGIDDSGTGVGINAQADDYSDTVTIDVADVTIDGTGSSTGIKIDDDSGSTNDVDLNLDAANDESSTIGPIGTGVDVSNGDISSDITNTTFEDIENEAITVSDGLSGDLNIESITVQANNNNVGAGTGVDFTGNSNVDVNSSDIDADTGILLDHSSDSRISRNTITPTTRGIDVQSVGSSRPSLTIQLNHIDAGDASATGVFVDDDGSSQVDLKYNDITGFTASDGFGLAGQVADDINDGTANWWGDDFGPQNESSTASAVDLSTSEEQDGTAAAYDPFLVVPVDAAHDSNYEEDLVSQTSDFNSKADIRDEDITLYAQDLRVRSGQSVAFPVTSANNISEAHTDFNGTVYAWNSTGQFFERATSETPTGLDAYVVQFDSSATGNEVAFQLEYASDTDGQAPAQGSFDYQEGLNVVGAAAYATSTSDVTTANTFQFDASGSSTSGASTITSYNEPNLARYSGDNIFKNTLDTGDGSFDGSDSDWSPYRAYVIDIESTDSDFTQRNSAKLTPGATLQELKDGLDQS